MVLGERWCSEVGPVEADPRDVYAVQLTAGQEVEVTVTKKDNKSLFVEMAVPGTQSLDGSNPSLVIDTRTSWGGTSWSTTFTPTVTGTYYLAIIARDTAEMYTVKVTS